MFVSVYLACCCADEMKREIRREKKTRNVNQTDVEDVLWIEHGSRD